MDPKQKSLNLAEAKNAVMNGSKALGKRVHTVASDFIAFIAKGNVNLIIYEFPKGY